MNSKCLNIIPAILLIISSLFADDIHPKTPPIKKFVEPGRIDALAPFPENQNLFLIQLDLSNDSLVTLINTEIPRLELWNGAASYQRIIPENIFNNIQNFLTEDFYRIISENYVQPDGRGYFVQYQYGNQASGIGGEIGYDCMCTDGSDCLIVGYNDDWWDPVDYYGEAWWSFSPPPLETIDFVEITVQGVQCDDLPVWSETYVTVKNSDCSWATDEWQAELSIDYTVNGPYMLPVTMYDHLLCDGAITPVIWSEDNYSVDFVKVEMYYTCNTLDSPNGFQASDGVDCSYIQLNWENNPAAESYTLYRDGTAIAPLPAGSTSYTDYSVSSGDHNYCIESENFCGSSFQSCDTGNITEAPLTPELVSASDGDYPDYIIITWDDVEDETGYKIYRDEIWLGLTSPNQTEFTDLFADAEIEYNYCVESLNDCGASVQNCDTGFTGILMGDVNNDDLVNVLDVVRTMNIILIIDLPPTDFELLAADINGDDMINVQDIILIINIILNF